MGDCVFTCPVIFVVGDRFPFLWAGLLQCLVGLPCKVLSLLLGISCSVGLPCFDLMIFPSAFLASPGVGESGGALLLFLSLSSLALACVAWFFSMLPDFGVARLLCVATLLTF